MAGLLNVLPAPLFNCMDQTPFPVHQAMFDPLLPKGLQWYWRGDFVNMLTDEAIEDHLAHAKDLPGALSLMHLYPIDGAVHRVGPNDTAWNARSATWAMVITGVDPDPWKAGELTTWARRYWAAIHAHTGGGGYVNFMMGDGDHARLSATYGDNYEPLVALKTKYDPTNFFRLNQNVAPAAAGPG